MRQEMTMTERNLTWIFFKRPFMLEEQSQSRDGETERSFVVVDPQSVARM
jgi:hypothetical protein